MFYKILIILIINIIAQAQEDGDIQALGDSSIIEMYYNGEWLPICDQDIDDNISNLICRDLGFDRAQEDWTFFENCDDSTYIKENGKDAEMEGNFGLDFSLSQFTCDETDESLLDCVNRIGLTWRESSSTCNSYSCKGIKCEDIPLDELSDEERYGLPEGDHKEGDVTIEDNNMLYYFNGEFWDPVCSFLFSSDEAEIICDKLGYYEGKEKEIDCKFVDKKGYRQHEFKNIYCSGDDELSECDITTDSCYLSDCIALTCTGKKEPLDDPGSILAYLLSGGGILLIIIIIIICKCRSDRKKKQVEKLKQEQLEQQIKFQQQQNSQIVNKPNTSNQNLTVNTTNQPIYQ